MIRLSRAALAAAFVTLAACSSGQAGSSTAQPAMPANAAEVRHPTSGLRVIPLKVGARSFRVEVAQSEAEQRQGLMFRTAMGDDEGMIFPRQSPDYASFWMRNTVIPLDIIFIGQDRRILNIEHGVPYEETPVSSAGVTLAVLELNSGRAAALGIKPGDRVDW